MTDAFDPTIAGRLFASDLTTLLKLIITYGRPCTEGDVRVASAILRRWLVEGMLGRLCHASGVQATMLVMDNAQLLDAIPDDGSIVYFMTGGVMFNGRPVMALFEQSTRHGPRPILPIGAGLLPQIAMSPSRMMQQRRIYHDGVYYRCDEIIKFMANRLGGVHLDFRRDEKLQRVEQAANYMSFGGPLLQMDRPPPGELYYDVEPNAREILGAFHIEIIAAAASLLSVHIDGQPLVDFAVVRKKPSLAARIKAKFRPSRLHLSIYEKEDFAKPLPDSSTSSL